MADRTYDAAIVGSGQAGGPLASALAGAGRKTILIEREHVGGTCVNEGCTPTKTMVASARVAYLARRAQDYGVATGPVSVDLARVRERKRAVVESFRGGGERRLQATANLDLVYGEARFTGPRSLAVRLRDGGEMSVEAGKVFLNTGARPSRPELPGLDSIAALESTSIMELDRVPEHLLIVGGGYIGLEFGQMFRRFGSRVTIAQRGVRLLAREDLDVANEVAAILQQDGIEIWLDTQAARVERRAEGRIGLLLRPPEGEHMVEGTHLLLAAGRQPNTDRLNLGAAGVTVDRAGFIQVNERLETSAANVYALGDVKGGPQFTHISYDDFRILRTNLLGKGGATTEQRLLPYTVYIDPQLGRIGLGEEEAKARGLDVFVARIPMSYVARALETDESRGFIKAVVDRKTERILGAAVLGLEGGEVMSILQTAMMGGLPYTALRDAVWAHPSLAEGLNTLFTV